MEKQEVNQDSSAEIEKLWDSMASKYQSKLMSLNIFL